LCNLKTILFVTDTKTTHKTYTVSHKKVVTIFVPVTSPNIVHFSKCFYLQTQQ